MGLRPSTTRGSTTPGRPEGLAYFGTATLGAYATIANLNLPLLGVAAGQSTLEGRVDQLPDDLIDFASPDAIRNWQARNGRLTNGVHRYLQIQAPPGPLARTF